MENPTRIEVGISSYFAHYEVEISGRETNTMVFPKEAGEAVLQVIRSVLAAASIEGVFITPLPKDESIYKPPLGGIETFPKELK